MVLYRIANGLGRGVESLVVVGIVLTEPDQGRGVQRAAIERKGGIMLVVR